MPSPPRNVSPKHLRVAELLERDIRQLAPGTPILPVTALMKRFGVSQGTVVHALRTLRTRGRITRPAGKKRLVTSGRGRSRDAVLNVLVLCPNWSSPDYNTTNQALLDEARRQRCALESVHYGAEWGKEWGVHWREILTRAVQAHDAVVVLPSSLPCELGEILHESGTPTVMFWEPELAAGMMCVAATIGFEGREQGRGVRDCAGWSLIAGGFEPGGVPGEPVEPAGEKQKLE